MKRNCDLFMFYHYGFLLLCLFLVLLQERQFARREREESESWENGMVLCEENWLLGTQQSGVLWRREERREGINEREDRLRGGGGGKRGREGERERERGVLNSQKRGPSD